VPVDVWFLGSTFASVFRRAKPPAVNQCEMPWRKGQINLIDPSKKGRSDANGLRSGGRQESLPGLL
jgi:hypothetical protein